VVGPLRLTLMTPHFSSALSILEQRVPDQGTSTQADRPQSSYVHELFEKQVLRTPTQVAAVFEGEQKTYEALNRQANRLARHLRALGVNEGALVGICLDRSITMIAGILAILKAGGAYVPLDPYYPQERVDFMLKDSGARWLLTHSNTSGRFSDYTGLSIWVDALAEQISPFDDGNLDRTTSAANLTYVIYTSGSTGRPKGVAMPHGPLVNLLAWQQSPSNLSGPARTLQFSPLSFDVSFQDVFSTLCSGGTLFLISEETRRDPMALLSFLSEHAIERIFLPYVALQQLADAAVASQRFPIALRDIITAGEQLQISQSLIQLFEQLPGCRLHNHYGPTESHVVAAYLLEGSPQEWPALPPIGRPIANARIFVLDPQNQPVAPGAEGELYIGGDCLALGYLNRPDLTAERFSTDPFNSEIGGRLYKTGDLGRYLPDGNLEYRGRADDQVKIRGFRIELGEIETVLRCHSSIQEAAVIARGDPGANKRLVAFMVLRSGHRLPMEEARRFLQQRLPEYMVPSAYLFLDALPLTASGKLDRRSLLSLYRENCELNRKADVPRDQLELQLVTIMEEILDVHPIGIKDDFFLLGGNSLLAAQLFTRVSKRFRKSLPLSTLFQAPSVEKLAPLIRAEGWTPNWTSFVPIQPEGSKPAFYCVHPVGGNILAYRDLARCLGSDQPVYGIQPQGLDGKGRPYFHIEDMAAHYIADLRNLQPQGPYCLGGLSFGGIVAYEMAQQLRAAGQEVRVLALFDTTAPGFIKPTAMRIPAHLRRFLSLAPKEKLTYFWARIAALGSRTREVGWQLSSSLCRLAGVSLPSFLLNLTFINDAAERNYVPKPYAGRMILFRAKEQFVGIFSDPLLGWSPYVAEGIEVHEIEGSHVEIVELPNVRILASILKKYLDRD
jgi:amino acid adenylation domain-containing protein